MTAESVKSTVQDAIGGRCSLYVVLDPGGRVVHWSPCFADLSRIDPARFPGTSLDPAGFVACLNGGASDLSEASRSIELPKGHRLEVIAKALPGGGSVIAAVAVEQGKPMSSAVALARIGYCVWDLSAGRSRTCSTDFAAIHGLPPGPDTMPALQLQSILQRIHPEDRQGYSEAISRLGKDIETYDLEFRVLDGSGGLRCVREVGDSSGPENSLIGNALLIAQDITEIKARESEMLSAHDKLAQQSSHLRQLATQLEQAKREAVGAATAKSDFLANISHELRTPLNAILGFSEIMKSNGTIPVSRNRFTEYAKDIHDSGLHLLNVIDDVLDVSKLEAGRLELKEETFVLRAVVKESLRLVAERAKRAKIEIVTEVPPELPQLLADRRRIKQVVLNLLSNAVKFTPDGGTVSVSAELEPDSGALILCVSDTGIGMSDEEIPIALAPFYQVGNVIDRKFEGTGLGLPLSKDLIELHGGSLSLESVVGKGTTVRVLLPKDRLVA